MSRRQYTRIIGYAALIAGAIILIRDLVQSHSIPYTVAGIGMLAFGAWRLQAAARSRP